MHAFISLQLRSHTQLSPILHVIVTRAYQLSFIDTYFLLSTLDVCESHFAFGENI